MKVSTKGRYGLRALVDLALNEDSDPIPLREIAERQKISIQYLEQLFATLRKAGFIKSIRGAHGGYKLNKSPENITVGDIIRTLEGPVAPADCVLDNVSCKLIDKCVTHNLWQKLRNNVEEALDSVTIKDITRSKLDNTEIELGGDKNE